MHISKSKKCLRLYQNRKVQTNRIPNIVSQTWKYFSLRKLFLEETRLKWLWKEHVVKNSLRNKKFVSVRGELTENMFGFDSWQFHFDF